MKGGGVKEFETKITLQKLKIANAKWELGQIRKETKSVQEKRKLTKSINELEGYYKGLEYAQELYYKN